MTTLEEISTSRRANRSFWNADVKLAITLYREAHKHNIQGHEDRCLGAVKAKLRSRNEFKYFG